MTTNPIETTRPGHIRVTVTTQAEANERVPLLLAAMTVREVRCVPREEIRLDDLVVDDGSPGEWHVDALHNEGLGAEDDEVFQGRTIDRITVAGENGPDAQPLHPDWVRSLRDQACAAGVEFVFESWGEWGTDSYDMRDGSPVFRSFHSFAEWVDKAPGRVFEDSACLDTAGNILRIGRDFMRARDEGLFPVTIVDRVGPERAGRLLDGRTWDAPHAGEDATP